MADKLTEKQIAIYKEVFNFYDLDHDGNITSKEVTAVMKSLGYDPNDAQVEAFIKEFDENKNGAIEFSEFLTIMSHYGIKGMEDFVNADDDFYKQLFSVFDIDGDGFITADELRKVMNANGNQMTDEEINEMMKCADKNGDGQINFEEFVKMMRNK